MFKNLFSKSRAISLSLIALSLLGFGWASVLLVNNIERGSQMLWLNVITLLLWALSVLVSVNTVRLTGYTDGLREGSRLAGAFTK